MASEYCTQEEIAADMGFCADLFRTRNDVKEAYKRGMMSAGVSLRHYQFILAKSGNPTMLIWLGKQYLDQRDQPMVDEENANKALDGLVEALKNATGR